MFNPSKIKGPYSIGPEMNNCYTVVENIVRDGHPEGDLVVILCEIPTKWMMAQQRAEKIRDALNATHKAS